MIRSMTGFGRASFTVDKVGFEVELRSVNHRYLDVRIRLPRLLAAFESDLKAEIRSRLERGRVDLSVAAREGREALTRVQVDPQAAEQYLAAARELAARHELSQNVDLTSLLGLPGVARFIELELPHESLGDALRRALGTALDALDAMRAREGEALALDLEARLVTVQERVSSLENRSGAVQQAARDRLRKRAEQLRQELGELDEGRLYQEIVIAADRLDVSEELVRLRSHVDQFRAILAGAGAGKPVGRRLDFLTQEVAREANTVGSKGSDAPIAHEVVELKTEIERIREQVQNVE